MSTAIGRASLQRTAAWQIAALVALCLIFFLPIIQLTIEAGLRSPSAAHAPAAIVLIAILLIRRRRIMAAALSECSIWGLVLIAVGLFMFVASSFPFNFQLSKRMSIAPTLAGAVLAAGGWRVMWRALPLILLLVLAVPIGSRFWAALVIRPETFTLTAVHSMLELLPGVRVEMEGLDLVYTRGGVERAIGLGQSYRGVSLILAYLTIGCFMTFARVRPAWQVIAMGVVALPIAVACCFLRLAIQSVVTIYTNAEPLNAVPRTIADVASLFLALALFGLVLLVLRNIVTGAEPSDDAPGDTTPASAPPAPGPRRAAAPVFVMSAALLLAATLGLRPGVAALTSYYSKEPIDLRVGFEEFDPSAIAGFKFVGSTTGRDPLARNEDIGTEDWITYRFLAPGDQPMILHATYYSDPRESIPHTPEVCFRLAGATIDAMQVIMIDTPDLAPEVTAVRARLVEITQEHGEVVVLYTLNINDSYHAARWQARFALGWPGDRKVFLSKIEIVAQRSSNVPFDETVERCKRLLVESLKELRRTHLPRREDVARQ